MDQQYISYIYILPLVLSLYKEIKISNKEIICVGCVVLVCWATYKIVLKIKKNKYKYNIQLHGYVTITVDYFNGLISENNFSIEMESIMEELIEKYKNKFVITKKNEQYDYHDSNYIKNNITENKFNKYIGCLSLGDNIFLGNNDDIAVEISSSQNTFENKNTTVIECIKINIKLNSNTNNIYDFIKSTVKKYETNKNKRKNNIKIFTYVKNIIDESSNKSKMVFNEKILTDYENINNYETFEHIFNDNVELIKSDVSKMNDESFICKYGLKNKLCYLFHGHYGTGKHLL